MKSKKSAWFILASEIKPGRSAILGKNYLAFYTIHYVALLLISISLISCIIVITKILWNLKTQKLNGRRGQMDFSLRFPLYLALADFLWGISHFVDHAYLIFTETFPKSMGTSATLSINLWLFLGYQQMMHASLAAYMYLRVVRQYTLELGYGEWRLHLFCFSVVGITIAIFYPFGAFGCSGYWFLEDRNSTSGTILSFTVALVCTMNAICTTLGYHLIQKKVEEQKRLKVRVSTQLTPNQNSTRERGYHSTATQCLTTFVRNAACIYCPFFVLAWIWAFENVFGVVDPLTAFVIVLVANSSGWANAWGYFHNENLKKARANQFSPNSQAHFNGPNSNTDSTPIGSGC